MRPLLLPLILFFSLASHAQVCTGGLGDPIIKFTFGAGADVYGPALQNGITNLTYVKTTCPEGGPVGSYAIVHGPGVDCFTGDWVNFTGDHTGDPNGYFMLINASNPPSDFYVQTVNGLCPLTSYQFGAYIMNMASHSGEIPPNITFSIEKTDGTVLSSFQTGDVPIVNPAQWNQYAFSFTTPAGVSSVVVRMTNNAPGGYGNDLALDDITFRTSGPSVNIQIDGRSGDSAMFCSNAANTLQLTSTVGSCYAATAYQWQESTDHGVSWNDVAGAVNPAYTAFPVGEGNTLYRLTVAQAGNIGISACQVACLPDSSVVLPTRHPAISIGLQPDHICVDSLANFVARPVDGGALPHYQWMVNGMAAGTDDTVFTSATLSDGDFVNCHLTSNAVCAVTTTAASNTITVHLLPDVVSSVQITASANNICQDSVVIFDAAPVNGGVAPSYTWLVNGDPVGKDTSAYISGFLANGDLVSVIMTSDLVCSSPVESNVVSMTVYDIPRVLLPPDTIIAPGRYVELHPSISGPFDTFSWSPTTYLTGAEFLDPMATPRLTTTYQIVVTNGNGCTAKASERVEVFYDLHMPTAFTPNGDGHNDVYRVPPSIPLTIQHFSIYNRWGALLFTTANAAVGWNGTVGGHIQPTDTYIWVVEYYNPLAKRMMMQKGTFELIR